MSSAKDDTNGELRISKERVLGIPLHWSIQFTVAVAGSIVAWCYIHWFNGVRFSSADGVHSNVPPAGLLILCSTVSIMFPLWALFLIVNKLDRIRVFGQILSSILLLSFTGFIVNALLKDWFRSNHSSSSRWLILAALLVGILLYPLPFMRLKRKAERLASQGNYDGAMRISTRWLRSKPYGRPFQGSIMLQAGRYNEALELLREGAFDVGGRPQLKSVYLYFYAVTLVALERHAEAQLLLETAIQSPQKMGDYFRFSLAESLLTQNRDVEKAHDLLEQVVARLKTKKPSELDYSFLALCVALNAWTSDSRESCAKAALEIQKIMSEHPSIGKDSQAAVQNLIGTAWQRVGDGESGRAAFEQALALFPHGGTALDARRKLAELGQAPNG